MFVFCEPTQIRHTQGITKVKSLVLLVLGSGLKVLEPLLKEMNKLETHMLKNNLW